MLCTYISIYMYILNVNVCGSIHCIVNSYATLLQTSEEELIESS